MFAVPQIIQDNLGPSVAIAIVVIGLLVLGLRDLLRFSPVRVAAISSVCFRQSIRRRVLWITPVVIVGILIISQFQKPMDPQDAIRQTTVYCLFATGLLVTTVAIILASTNLPREIETRVIYTVATKPTTRLEIVAGKVLGFALVAFWILLIMGAFTYGYLKYRDWRIRSLVTTELEAGLVEPVRRPTLEYYRDHGTLHARELGSPDVLNIYAHLPASPADRWVPGDGEGELFAHFSIGRGELGASPGQAVEEPLVLQAIVRTRPVEVERESAEPPATQPAERSPPRVSVYILDGNRQMAASGDTLGIGPEGLVPDEQGIIQAVIPPTVVDELLRPGGESVEIIAQIVAMGEGYEYSLSPQEIVLASPAAQTAFGPLTDILFAGRTGRYGQQLRGGREPDRVAIYEFRDEKLEGLRQETYTFELRVGIEPDYSDVDVTSEAYTHVVMDFFNGTTGGVVENITIPVESNRPSYFAVPAAAVEGGDFAVIVRSPSPAWIGLRSGELASLKLVIDDQSFAWNLVKSLSVLWLLSLLVTIVAVFCSTFLSWPIAVVLTCVILAGRWGTDQLGDMLEPGFGRTTVDTFFRGINPTGARAVSESVDALVQMLNTVSGVLPDIARFRALEEIEQGMAISPREVLWPSLRVALGYGIPLLVLSYIFLRYKEVAP